MMTYFVLFFNIINIGVHIPFWIRSFPHPFNHLFVNCFMMDILKNVRWYLTVFFYMHLSNNSDIEHVFIYLMAICMSYLEKYLFRSYPHWLIGFLFDIVVWTVFVGCTFWKKISSQYIVCIFILFMVSFAVQNLKSFIWPQLFILVFIYFALLWLRASPVAQW